MKRNLFLIAAIATMGSANAFELLQNTGFEDATPTNFWNPTSNNVPTDNAGAFGGHHTGAKHAWLGGWGTGAENATLSQTVAIASGHTATLSFWMCRSGSVGSPATFDVSVNGNTVVGGLVSSLSAYVGGGGDRGYTFYSYDISSYAGGNATVKFEFNKAAATTDANWFIDDTSIDANPIPEPGTIFAIGAGLALVALRRRK